MTKLETHTAVARALGHPARLRAVAMLRSGELCVCQVVEVLGLAGSTVSLHLKELKRAGLVEETKRGRWVHLALTERNDRRRWIEAALESVAGDEQIAADAERIELIRELPVEELCRLGFEEAWARKNRRMGSSESPEETS